MEQIVYSFMHASRKVELKNEVRTPIVFNNAGAGDCLSVLFSNNIGRECQLLKEDVFGTL